MKFILILLVALSLSSCHVAQFFKIQKALQAETMKQYSFKREMPFKLVKGFIIVEATIGDKTGDFILDTGASTMLNDGFVKNIPFRTIGKRKHKDVHGKKQLLKTVKLDKLSVGGIDFQGIVASVSDLEVLKLLKEGLCVNVSGILGVNVMNKGIWQIDYLNKKITITDSRDSLNLPSDKKTISFYPTDKGTPIVRITQNDVYLGEAELDTGNSGDFIMQKQIIEKLPSANKIITKQGLSGGLFGMQKETSYIVILPMLTLGQSFEINNIQVSFSNSLSSKPLIGYQFLKDYVVTIDWKYQEVTFSSFKPSSKNPFLTYGFSPVLKDGKFIIGSIIEQSAADKAGFMLNDQILQINEKDYRQITQADYCNFLQQNVLENNDKLLLIIKRGDKEVKQELLKSDLMEILIKK